MSNHTKLLLFQTTSGLENSPGYVFRLEKFKNDVEIALKPNGFKLYENPIKIYHSVYIFKRKRCDSIAE